MALLEGPLNRDIFIYRAHPDTSKRDIEDGIRGRNFEVRDLVCFSNEQSVLKSFKLTVPASQLSSLLTDEFPWPEGVKIRRSSLSRRDQASTKRWFYCAVFYALSTYIHIHIYNSNYGNEISLCTYDEQICRFEKDIPNINVHGVSEMDPTMPLVGRPFGGCCISW